MNKFKMLVLINSSFYFNIDNFHLLDSLLNLTSIRLDDIKFSIITKSLVQLKNLHKLYMRNGKSLDIGLVKFSHVFPNMREMVIDFCDTLKELPVKICELIHLIKLKITHYFEIFVLPEAIENLMNLEMLRLRFNLKLLEVSDSIENLDKLNFLEISFC